MAAVGLWYEIRKRRCVGETHETICTFPARGCALGTPPARARATATVVPQAATPGPAPAPLQATAAADAPASVRGDSPAIQVGRRGEPVAEPLVVAVVDRYGNPVAGVEVKWKT